MTVRLNPPIDLRVPIRTIIAVGHEPYSMSKDLLKYPWMIRPIFRYQDKSHLLDNLRTEIIDVAERNRRKIDQERMKEGW